MSCWRLVAMTAWCGVPGVRHWPPTRPARQPAPAAEKKIDTGDNAWVLTSSALVLMMTGPGLALFYCGLVRKKNVLSVMMQCVFLMCLMTRDLGPLRLHAGLRRQSGQPAAWIGDGRYLFMHERRSRPGTDGKSVTARSSPA